MINGIDPSASCSWMSPPKLTDQDWQPLGSCRPPRRYAQKRLAVLRQRRSRASTLARAAASNRRRGEARPARLVQTTRPCHRRIYVSSKRMYRGRDQRQAGAGLPAHGRYESIQHGGTRATQSNQGTRCTARGCLITHQNEWVPCSQPLSASRCDGASATLQPSSRRAQRMRPSLVRTPNVLGTAVGDIGTAARGCRLGVTLQAWTLDEGAGNDLDEPAKRAHVAVGGGG
jgi:hypothetical protein